MNEASSKLEYLKLTSFRTERLKSVFFKLQSLKETLSRFAFEKFVKYKSESSKIEFLACIPLKFEWSISEPAKEQF